MKKILISLIFLISSITAGCEEKIITATQIPTDQELEAIVKGNSITLFEAVEEFANDNNGYYPQNADSDTTLTGKILIDYLPEGERLVNPFTGAKDQPIDSVPSSPGEISYYLYYSNCNVYSIQGYGVNSIIIEHDNIEELEALVVEDCLALQNAVEAWRKDYFIDYYPCSNFDVNDIGNTISAYLPGGHLMKNRFTMTPAEPTAWDYPPNLIGAIGYECNAQHYSTAGYTITAFGFEPGIVICKIIVN